MIACTHIDKRKHTVAISKALLMLIYARRVTQGELLPGGSQTVIHMYASDSFEKIKENVPWIRTLKATSGA